MTKFNIVLCILTSIFVVLFVLLLILVIVEIYYHNLSMNAWKKALVNELECPSTNGGKCENRPDMTLVPPNITDIPINQYNSDAARFAATLIQCVEGPFSYNLKSKELINLPDSVAQLGRIFYKKNVFAAFAYDELNKTVYFIFRGTATIHEWQQDMNYSHTNVFPSTRLGKYAAKFISYGATNRIEQVNEINISSNCACTKYNKNSDTTTAYELSHPAMIHEGFSQIFADIEKQLDDFLAWPACRNASRVVVSGHSLGAAMATLLTEKLQHDVDLADKTTCYVFGSPRVGNKEFVDLFIRNNIHSLVNSYDIVTQMPLAVMPNEKCINQPLLFEDVCPNKRRIFFDNTLKSLLNAHVLITYLKHV